MLLEYYRHALALAQQTARHLQRPLQTLDFGGGLGIPYFAGQNPLDLAALQRGLAATDEQCRADPWLESTDS